MEETKKSFWDKPLFHKVLGTDPTKPEEMQPKEVLSYSFAGFGQNLICQLVSSFFLFYLTDAVKLPTFPLAVMFLCARLFDAFNDPIMGTIVDRTRTKNGKMRPYLKAMPIPIGVLTILLFSQFIPTDTSAGVALPFAISTIIYLAWGICYTIVDVPYWGLASSMTKDTDKRNTMLTIARLFCTIGAGIVTVLLPVIQGIIETNVVADILVGAPDKVLADGTVIAVAKDTIMSMKDAVGEGYIAAAMSSSDWISIQSAGNTVWKYIVVDAQYSQIEADLSMGYKIFYLISAVIIAVCAVPTFFVGYKNTKERYYEDESQVQSLGHNIKLLMKNKPALLLILTGFLGCLRLIYMTSGIYYAKYCLGNVGMNSILTLLVVPGGLIATVTTPILSKKLGKRNLFIISHLIGGIAMTALYFLGRFTGEGDGSNTISMIMFFIVLILLGLPSGYSNIIQYAMIADSIDYLEDRTGERAEGICFSLQTLISKIGMAFVAFVVLMVLSVGGYDGASKVSAPINIRQDIWMMTTLLCGLSTVLCVVPLFFYNFNEDKQREAVKRVTVKKLAGLTPDNWNSWTEEELNEAIARYDEEQLSLATASVAPSVDVNPLSESIALEEIVEEIVENEEKND